MERAPSAVFLQWRARKDAMRRVELKGNDSS